MHFPRSDSLTLFAFDKVSTKYTNLSNQTFVVLLSSKNGVPWKK